MKRLKLILATLVAVLIACIGATNVSADVYTVTVNGDTTGHTYESYQIFKGDLAGDTLSNIEWGNGITKDGQEKLQQKYSVKSAAEVAKKLDGVTDDAAEAKEFAAEVSKHLQKPGGLTGLAAGYYLIKDQDNTLENTDKSYTSYILEVVKNTQVTPKASVPTVQKKVKDINDTVDAQGTFTNWQDSADHDFNDKVPFQLTATLPSNYTAYDTYYLEFADTMSKGLKFEQNSVKVTVDEQLVANGYAIKTSEGGFSLSFSDLKKAVPAATANSKVVVEYTATLGEDAVIGSNGNPNEVELIYSNDPNHKGGGTDEPKGKTPKDKVIVFTYKTVVNKVDGKTKDPLKGAEFTLSKILQDKSEVVIKTVEVKEGTEFTFKGLDDGNYILRETQTPSGYNTINDITFTITAEHGIEDPNPKLTDLSGKKVTGEIEFTRANANEDALTATVENNKGSELPSTGSIGTTLLYIIGASLAVGAGILLVTKKRMEN